MSIRTERVAGEIQQALGLLLQTDFRDVTSGMITVTKVRMSPDLRTARVYVSVFGGNSSGNDTITALKVQSGRIRAGVARQVRLKFVPELFFYLDDTQDEVAKVEDIFRQIARDRPAGNPEADTSSIS